MISGKPVKSSMARTSSPAASSADAVPPVEMISTPSSESPCAKSTMPVLSDTESTARRMRTSPGWVIAPPRDDSQRRDQHAARVGRVDADGVARDQAYRLAQQLVLDRAQRVADRGGLGRLGEVERALEDDRAGVDALIDEVDGDTEHLHAVGERLLDRPDAGEGRQQRGVDVDDALREAAEEVGVEQLHVAGEDHEVDALLDEPVGHRPSRARRSSNASRAKTAVSTPAAARARAPCASGLSEPTATTSMPSRPWTRVEDRLQVRARPRGEDADPHATSSFGNRPPVERSVPACSSASTRSSTASARKWPYVP